jgi:2-iminoacetate synthase
MNMPIYTAAAQILFSVYQETYNTNKYEQVHVRGPKRIYPYRFHAQERALRGGMRGVAFGALLGLDDYRKDAYAAGLHAYYIQQKYPHAEISFSTPRLRPYINNEDNKPNDVHEKQLLQVMLAYRLFMPYAGITISTRERAGFRDHVIGNGSYQDFRSVRLALAAMGKRKRGMSSFKSPIPGVWMKCIK